MSTTQQTGWRDQVRRVQASASRYRHQGADAGSGQGHLSARLLAVRKLRQHAGRIGHLVFDCAVHHGVKTAIKLLQRALKVADDGEFGPVTRGQLLARDTNRTADLLMAHRMLYLMTCSAWPTYKLGWAKRCFSVARAA